MEDGSDEAQQRLNWLSEQTVNVLQKHYELRKNNVSVASYSEEMSELKSCPLLAVQYIQLCKVDDARSVTVHFIISKFYFLDSIPSSKTSMQTTITLQSAL